jgi:hypothetical protein
MKSKKQSIKDLNKLDAKDRSFLKDFGELHPINELK